MARLGRAISSEFPAVQALAGLPVEGIRAKALAPNVGRQCLASVLFVQGPKIKSLLNNNPCT